MSTGKRFIENSFGADMNTKAFVGQDWSSEYDRRSSNQAQTSKQTKKHIYETPLCSESHWVPGQLLPVLQFSYSYFYFDKNLIDWIITRPKHHFIGQFAYNWCNTGIS